MGDVKSGQKTTHKKQLKDVTDDVIKVAGDKKVMT